MEYRVVFDIAEAGYKSWSFAAYGLIFVAVGAGLALAGDRWPGLLGNNWWANHPRMRKGFLKFFLVFAILWTVLSFSGTFFEYWSLKSAWDSGEANVAEGMVTNFIPMPATDHGMEKFCVNNACFEYSDYVITAGFNNTASHGGPIKEGLPVRVMYVGSTIVKLELAK